MGRGNRSAEVISRNDLTWISPVVPIPDFGRFFPLTRAAGLRVPSRSCSPKTSLTVAHATGTSRPTGSHTRTGKTGKGHPSFTIPHIPKPNGLNPPSRVRSSQHEWLSPALPSAPRDLSHDLRPRACVPRRSGPLRRKPLILLAGFFFSQRSKPRSRSHRKMRFCGSCLVRGRFRAHARRPRSTFGVPLGRRAKTAKSLPRQSLAMNAASTTATKAPSECRIRE